MPYADDPAASIGEAVRFWAQDTTSPPLISDNELAYFIDYVSGYSSDPLLIAAALCVVIGSKYAKVASISIDGGSISGDQLQDKMRALAVDLRAEWSRLNSNKALPYAGGISFYDFVSYGVKPPLFAIGMSDYDPVGLGLSAADYNDGVLDVSETGWIYPG